MKEVFKLAEFVDNVDEVADGNPAAYRRSLAHPIVNNLRRLRRLGLLKDDVILAPGSVASCSRWAKKAGRPVALMRLDLLSDDLDFVVLRQGQLVVREQVSADTIAGKMGEPGMTGERLQAWIVEKMKAAIDEGLANAD